MRLKDVSRSIGRATRTVRTILGKFRICGAPGPDGATCQQFVGFHGISHKGTDRKGRETIWNHWDGPSAYSLTKRRKRRR